MTKILLAVTEDEAESWFISTPLNELDHQSHTHLIPQTRFEKLEKECEEEYAQAIADAQEMLKQERNKLIDEILKCGQAMGNGCDVVRLEKIEKFREL